MIEKCSCMLIHGALFTIILTATTLFADDTMPIPNDKSQLEAWFNKNVKPYTEQKNILDPALVAAEESFKVIKVMKDGTGEFKTITDAINSIPIENTIRFIIYIGGGVYKEKIKVERTKPFITLYGLPNDMPNLTFSGTAAEFGTVDSATLIVESDYFTAVNIVIRNDSPKPDRLEGAQAVALRTSGDKASFYNCKIIGFQDTLCDDRGFHFFKDCYIEGTVDFIFGSGTSLYLNTELHVLGDTGLTIITAQAREYETEKIGYSFVHCNITGTGNNTYLGRAWKSRPRVVYAYTNMSDIVNPKGWSDNFFPQRDNTVFYGEYKNIGLGSSANKHRVKYAKELTDVEVQPFLNLGYIMGSKWLLPPPNPKL